MDESGDARCELRIGDCLKPGGLETLADRSVDVVITDPPYSEHTHSKQRRGFNRARELGFGHITPAETQAAAAHFARLARRWVLVFSDNESVSAWISALTASGLEHVRVGCWVKIGCTPQFTGDRPASGHESIVIAHPKGRKRWNGGGTHAVWQVPIVLERSAGSEPRVHTTQKPLALMSALVRDFSEPGELVLDPFAGSATTGVACRLLGRSFIGWERNPETAAVARKRLDSAAELRIDVERDQLGLFALVP